MCRARVTAAPARYRGRPLNQNRVAHANNHVGVAAGLGTAATHGTSYTSTNATPLPPSAPLTCIVYGSGDSDTSTALSARMALSGKAPTRAAAATSASR